MGFEVAVELAFDTSALKSPAMTRFFRVICTLPSISSNLLKKEESSGGLYKQPIKRRCEFRISSTQIASMSSDINL